MDHVQRVGNQGGDGGISGDPSPGGNSAGGPGGDGKAYGTGFAGPLIGAIMTANSVPSPEVTDFQTAVGPTGLYAGGGGGGQGSTHHGGPAGAGGGGMGGNGSPSLTPATPQGAGGPGGGGTGASWSVYKDHILPVLNIPAVAAEALWHRIIRCWCCWYCYYSLYQ